MRGRRLSGWTDGNGRCRASGCDPPSGRSRTLGDQRPSVGRRARCPGPRASLGRTFCRKTAKNYRQPFEYREVLTASGVTLSDREITARYYRERAIPHLISFPVKRLPRATDPTPEGLELWDVSSPLIDRLGGVASRQPFSCSWSNDPGANLR